MSTELSTAIDQVLERADLPDRHSYFQIKKFIIGKECTAQGQLWQIIRELRARKETVDELTRQLENAMDDMELLDIQIDKQCYIHSQNHDENILDQLNKREAEVHIRKLKRNKQKLQDSIEVAKHKIKYAQEESSYFLAAFEEIEKIEKLKPMDDAEAQIEYWNEKLLEEFNLRVILRNPLDTELVKTIMALNDDAPVKKHLTAMLKSVQENMIQNNQRILEKLNQQPEVKPTGLAQGRMNKK